MSNSASDDARSELSSQEDSELSETIAASPRVRRSSSVHTAAAQAMVGRRRTLPSRPPSLAPPPPPRPPSARSVHYAPLSPMSSTRGRPQSSGRRPPPPVAEAEALAGVAPHGADRLKHLQLHMEQLQQLYAQEIHKEELAAREAFIQSMCTASITLWRYVSSRGRFYTAVKALVTQYLPASNARLYQVEKHSCMEQGSSDPGLSLVLGDGRVVEVATKSSDVMGVAGHAVLSVSQLSSSQWKKLQQSAAAIQPPDRELEEDEHESEGDVSFAPSPSSSLASSEAEPSTHLWLDRHADCVVPSGNDHLVLLMPMDRVYNARFHCEMDLTIKKKELIGLAGSQLLVVVLRDSEQCPIGVVEALVSAKKPLKVDFLDAFSSLLAAALEARRSICRPVAVDGGVHIEIVHDDGTPIGGKQLQQPNPGGEATTAVEIEIALGTTMIVTGAGPHSFNPENDMPILEGAREAMAKLWAQADNWKQLASLHSHATEAHNEFWCDVVGSLVRAHETRSSGSSRAELRAAISRLNVSLVEVGVIHLLFEDESLDEYAANATADANTAVLSVEGQFGALRRAIQEGKTFESTPCAVAQPVKVADEDKAMAAVLLLMAKTSENFVVDIRTQTLSLVVSAVQLTISKEKTTREKSEKTAMCAALQATIERQKERQRTNDELLRLGQILVKTTSLEQLIGGVNEFAIKGGDCELLSRLTLFVAETESATLCEGGNSPSLRSVWTVCNGAKQPERVVLYDRESVTSPKRVAHAQNRGGMAAFVLESGRPLSYSPHHESYDPTLRRKLTGRDAVSEAELLYYAVPLHPTLNAGTVGVLELAFASEDQHDAFVDSPFSHQLSETVANFFQLHVWLSQRELQHAQSEADTREKEVDTWRRWTQFVSDWCGSPSFDLYEWRGSTVRAIQKLIPTASGVNILFGGNTEESALIQQIQRELRESSGATSPALNLLNHNVLRSFAVFPLQDAHIRESDDEATGDGILVLSATGADPFNDDEKRFGAMIAQLVTGLWRSLHALTETKEQNERLQAAQADLGKELTIASQAKRLLLRRCFQHRILSRLNRLTCSADGSLVELRDATVQKAIGAIADECAKEGTDGCEGSAIPQTPLWVVVIACDESECTLWGAVKGRGYTASIPINGSLFQPSTIHQYLPPFPDHLMPVIQEMIGSEGELFVQGSRVFISPLASSSSASEHSRNHLALMILTSAGDDDDTIDNAADEAFVKDLTQGFNRVLAWRNTCQQTHDLQIELFTRTAERERVKRLLENAQSTHSHWERLWRVVMTDALVLGCECLDEGALTALRAKLVGDMETSIQTLLRAYLSGVDVEDKIDLKILLGDTNDDTQAFLHPHETRVLANQQPRRLPGEEDSSLEVKGGAAVGICIATSTRTTLDCDASEERCKTVTLRYAAGIAHLKWGAVDATVERVLPQCFTLVARVGSVLDLHRGRIRGVALAASQDQLLREKSASIDGLASALNSQSLVERTIQRFLASLPQETQTQSSVWTSSLCQTLQELPGYRLWIHETTNGTLWSMQHDGSKLLRSTDDMNWSSQPHTSIIKVAGEHVALLEYTGEVSGGEQEVLALISSTLQACFSHQNSLRTLQDLRLAAEASEQENAERRRCEDDQNSRLVRHWHHTDELLRSRISGEQESAVDWSDILRQVEADAVKSVDEIEEARVAVVELDLCQHQATVVSTSLDPPGAKDFADSYGDLASQLELWSSAAPARVDKWIHGDAMMDVSKRLLSKKPHAALHCILAVAVCVGTTVPCDTSRFYVVAMCLVSRERCNTSASFAASRAMEVDSQLVATAVANWRRLEATHARVTKAETVSVSLKEELSTAQQWTEFMHRVMEECQLLLATTTKMTVVADESESADVRELKTRVEQFTQSVCGCEAFELFAVVPESLNSEPRDYSLTPLLSSLDKPCESIENLQQLLDRHSSDTVSFVCSSPSGSGYRVFSTLRLTDRLVGMLVLHWHSQPPPLPNATLELVDSIVVPWLTLCVQLIQRSSSHTHAFETNRKQIASLSEEKAAMELEGLQFKSHLMQCEQRNADLQHVIQTIRDVFCSMEKATTTIGEAQGAAAVWETLVKELTAMGGVEGAQLYEMSGTSTVARLVVSTLSAGDDEVLEKAILDSAGRKGIVATSFHSKVIQETRVAFQSTYKRVQCVSVGGNHSKCVVIVYDNHNDNHHVTALTERCVGVMVRAAARRVAELEATGLQVVATVALEETTKDLTAQLQLRTQALAHAQHRSEVVMALHHTLIEDLFGNEIWHGIERPPQAASFPTAKLVIQWRFLQDAAQRRLRSALSDDASIQLYGVGCAGGHDSFVFSLPSQVSMREQLDSHKKGFYCVAVTQLQQQKREWRVMAKCILKRSRTAVDGKSRSQLAIGTKQISRTVFFPILKCTTRDNHEEQSNNDEDDSDAGDADASVVGVLAVKTKDAIGITADGGDPNGLELLIQEFANALASRIELIGRIVNQKQQRRKSQHPALAAAPAAAPAALAHVPTTTRVIEGEARGVDYQQERSGDITKQAVGDSAVASSWTRDRDAHVGDGRSNNSIVSQYAAAEVASSVSVAWGNTDSQRVAGNQAGEDRDEDVDSEDERQAEQMQQRVNAAVASALLAFSFRVQSLEANGDSVAALRSLVMRDLKNVWIHQGDERKRTLDVELFFVVDGAVCDRLHGLMEANLSSSPLWLLEFAQKRMGGGDAGALEGFRLWTLDARRWVASLSERTSSATSLVALSGPTDLRRIFDATDELTHLPSLLRILHLHVARVLQASAQADYLARQRQEEKDHASHQLIQAEEREEELKRRGRREEELNLVTKRLLQAADERAIIQMGLHAMKQWLQCTQVAFHAAPASIESTHQVYSDKQEAGVRRGTVGSSGAMFETILRVPVHTGEDGNTSENGRELVGTMVARLSDRERQSLDEIHLQDGKEWLLRLLHRLADAVGTAWEHLRQRIQLQESADRLMSASTEIEALQQQVAELQDSNSQLNSRVDRLEKDVVEHHAVVDDNDQLREELDHIRTALESSENERRGMADQVKRYETQLVEVNCQLEKSIRVETQFMQLEQTHAATQAREARLEKKLLKQKLQLKQLVAELSHRRDKDERDQAELVELRRQVAVLMEKQQHNGRMDATSVATAVMQAQAQVHKSQTETRQEQQQRVHSAVQKRMLQQMRLQQQSQKRKQLHLAQELKNLAAMEVREMQHRSIEQREQDVAVQLHRIRSQSPTKAVRSVAEGGAKVHNISSQSSDASIATSMRPNGGGVAASKLRSPSVVVPTRRGVAATASAAPL